MRPTIFATLLAAAIGITLPVTAATQERRDSGQPSPEQAVLLRALADETMLPMVVRFEVASNGMAASVPSFCDGSIDLAALQAAWHGAMSAWQPLEMLQIGPASERRTQRQVNFWPVRPSLLQRLQSALPVSPERMHAAAPSGKGFPAIEYLLHEARARRTERLDASRCQLLQALSSHVAWEARGLADAWRAPGEGYASQLKKAGTAGSGGLPSADQVISDTLNLLISGIDTMASRKLGKPLEKSTEQLPQESLEAWRSGTSLDWITENLRGFETVFFGAAPSGVGFDDHLAAMGRAGLARVVRERLDTAYRALSSVHAPLERAIVQQRSEVQALHQALSGIQTLLETEVADALKVDLGFNTADGD